MHFNDATVSTNYKLGAYYNGTNKDVDTEISIDGTGEDIIHLMDRPGFTDWHNILGTTIDNTKNKATLKIKLLLHSVLPLVHLD
jgi:hypothetical protein